MVIYRSGFGRHGCGVQTSAFALLLFAVIRLCQLYFRFAKKRKKKTRPPWPVPQMLSLCWSWLIYRGARYAFTLLIAVDLPLGSTRLCRPEVLSVCCSLLIYGWASCMFALRIMACCARCVLALLIAVDIPRSQICSRFAGLG